MLEHSIVGIYGTLGAAETAARSLRDAGFPVKKISVVAKHLEDKHSLHGFAMACDEAKPAAVTGLWLGGIFGILLAGGALFWVPEFGPLIVAGSVGEALVCLVEGAVGGASVLGLLGFLFGTAISKKTLEKYEAALKAGKFLVIARGPEEEIVKAQDVLEMSGAENMERHSATGSETK